MRFDVVTIFPEMIECVLGYGIISRAINSGTISVKPHDLRDYTENKHRQVDDTPYGGGAGMVMKPEPFFKCVSAIKNEREGNPRIILLSPQGKLFDQSMAKDLSKEDWIILLCGRYEGIDTRVEEHLATDIVSTGDYVLSGGELPAVAVIDSVSRLVPGVLGAEVSAKEETFEDNLLEYPQYTRPEDYMEMKVPPVLLSGNHKIIGEWRKEKAVERTAERRPDLLSRKKGQ